MWKAAPKSPWSAKTRAAWNGPMQKMQRRTLSNAAFDW